MARVLIDGQIVLDTFKDQAAQDPLVRKLAEKVEMEVDPDIRDTKEGTRPCKVTIRQTDGKVLSDQVEYPKGSPQMPLSSEELKMKFSECAARILSRADVDRVLQLLDRLDKLDRLDSLFALLIGAPS